ncbi:MAG: hypothetical protein OXG56_00890 [Gammaproteobacteria bacterium]|nr:hypothetical protein [Gammaproteobacteria bacterium]
MTGLDRLCTISLNLASREEGIIVATEIILRHEASGLVKPGYYGFSWTYLFFGFFVPAIRGEILISLLHFVLNIVTFGIWWIAMMFLYNKQYMRRMLENGWILAGSDAENQLAAASIGVMLQQQGRDKPMIE